MLEPFEGAKRLAGIIDAESLRDVTRDGLGR